MKVLAAPSPTPAPTGRLREWNGGVPGHGEFVMLKTQPTDGSAPLEFSSKCGSRLWMSPDELPPTVSGEACTLRQLIRQGTVQHRWPRRPYRRYPRSRSMNAANVMPRANGRPLPTLDALARAARGSATAQRGGGRTPATRRAAAGGSARAGRPRMTLWRTGAAAPIRCTRTPAERRSRQSPPTRHRRAGNPSATVRGP